MIGEKRRAQQLKTALPAEARSLSRLLHLLQQSHVASAALLGSLLQMPPSPQCQEISTNLKETLASLQNLDLPFKQMSDRMSIATELAIRTAFHNPDHLREDGKIKGEFGSPVESDVESIAPPMTAKATKTSAAIVSDSSTAGSETETEIMNDMDVAVGMKKFWGSLLEAVNLQVASRTTSVWGKKKIYEVYHLSAPVSLAGSLDDIRKNVEMEFRTVFHGGGEDHSGCRTYAVMSAANSLYIQLNIGKHYDFSDERNRATSGEKKKKADYEFIAIVNSASPIIALTASRAPSRSRLTKFVLTALDAALTQNKSATTAKGIMLTVCAAFCPLSSSTCLYSNSPVLFAVVVFIDMIPTRVGDWAGQEPQELLASASAVQSGRAVGRFANYASEAVVDPLTELHTAWTASLIDRSAAQKRLEIGAQHGRSTAQLVMNVDAPAELVAINDGGMLVDHSAQAKLGRKRARDGQLGREGECPRLQRLCWKWTGETCAASACWLEDGGTSVHVARFVASSRRLF